MSEHVTDDLLSLEAAGALDAGEAGRLAVHLRGCATCAARAEGWRDLAAGLRSLPQTRPSPTLLERTRRYVEWQIVERTERAWQQTVVGLLIAFGWMLAGLAWVVLALLRDGLTLLLGRPLGPTALWFAAYLVAGCVMGGAAAVLLGHRAREEGRTV